LSTALKKLPSEIRTMTLPQYYELFDYWGNWPPEHESLAILLSVYTTWEPANAVPKTEAEAQAKHRASLEARWKAGAMNAKQMFESMGGVIGGQPGALLGANPPGIGPFPGAH
jgi:hypothetical protein